MLLTQELMRTDEHSLEDSSSELKVDDYSYVYHKTLTFVRQSFESFMSQIMQVIRVTSELWRNYVVDFGGMECSEM